MAISCPNAAILILFFTFPFFQAKAQISTACTSSVISSFTPCLNFVTGSSSGAGRSPTQDCCDSLKSLMTDNVDCACLVVTGNIPVSIPFVNSSLAISLPRACKSSVPLQCKATGVPLPPPGPVLFGPTSAPALAPALGTRLAPTTTPALAPAPHSRRHSPRASKASTSAAPPAVQSSGNVGPEAPPPKFTLLGPTANPGIRPVYNPNSASTTTMASSIVLLSPFVLASLLAVGVHRLQ